MTGETYPADQLPALLKSQKKPRSWTLTFGGHPPSPNDRLHWRTKAKWARCYRRLAYSQVLVYKIPSMERIRLSAVIVRRNLGVADEDNDRARLKSIADGLVDARVVPNDTREYIEWASVTEQHGQKSVILTIEEIA